MKLRNFALKIYHMKKMQNKLKVGDWKQSLWNDSFKLYNK
jgi:hypothetical protein